jgi:hypothetical protein
MPLDNKVKWNSPFCFILLFLPSSRNIKQVNTQFSQRPDESVVRIEMIPS